MRPSNINAIQNGLYECCPDNFVDGNEIQSSEKNVEVVLTAKTILPKQVGMTKIPFIITHIHPLFIPIDLIFNKLT